MTPDTAAHIQQVNTTYEPFSQEPEYIAVNEEFMACVDLSGAHDLLDLACGTGLMAQLARRQNPGLRVVGADLSLESMLLARLGCAERHEALPSYLRSSADRLPLLDDQFDAALMGNSIHMLDDQATLLAEVARVLRPGALFAFNTSFYAGTFAEGTAAFYHDWVKLALQYVMRKSAALKAEGKPPIPRKRGKGRAALQTPWYTIEEWNDGLSKAGLTVEHSETRTVELTAHSFRTIGAYGGFSEVLLSGYPVAESSEALQATAGDAMKAHGREVVPRYWL